LNGFLHHDYQLNEYSPAPQEMARGNRVFGKNWLLLEGKSKGKRYHLEGKHHS